MNRPHFTVTVRGQNNSDIAYDANHIAVTRQPDATSTDIGQMCYVSFVCSGRMVTVPATDVVSIQFHPTGATWCADCDAPLNYVGLGPYADLPQQAA